MGGLASSPSVIELIDPNENFNDWRYPTFSERYELVLCPGETIVGRANVPIAASLVLPQQLDTGPDKLASVDGWTLPGRAELIWTTERIVYMLRDFDKGSSFIGAGLGGVPIALAATAVSKVASARRSHGRVAAGQVRYEWMVAARIELARSMAVFGKSKDMSKVVLLTGGTDKGPLDAISLKASEQTRSIYLSIMQHVIEHRLARFKTVYGDNHQVTKKCAEIAAIWRGRPPDYVEAVLRTPIGDHCIAIVDEAGVRSDLSFWTRSGAPDGYRTAPTATLPGRPAIVGADGVARR